MNEWRRDWSNNCTYKSTKSEHTGIHVIISHYLVYIYRIFRVAKRRKFPFHFILNACILERKCRMIVRPWDEFKKSSKSCIVFLYESCTVFTRVNFFLENLILWRLISAQEKSKIMQDEGKDKKWEVKNCASWNPSWKNMHTVQDMFIC